MNMVAATWFLCFLLFVAGVGESAITVVPSTQHRADVLLIGTLALAGLSGLLAARLSFRRRTHPQDWIFHSKRAAVVAWSAVSLLAVAVLWGIVG